MAVGAVAADEVGAFGDFLEEPGDVVGIILAVAVEEDDDFSASGVDAGVEGGALASILGKFNDLDGGGADDAGAGLVGGAVIDEDELVIDGGEGFGDFFLEGGDIFFFVEERDDERDGGHGD